MLLPKSTDSKVLGRLIPLLACSVLVFSGCAAQNSDQGTLQASVPAIEAVIEKPAPVVVTDADHCKVISPFGPRKSGKRTRMHQGVDIKADRGCAILAWDEGEVILAGERRGYGLSADVRHSNGLVTRYAHMSRLAVKKGDRVFAGVPVGAIGRTGRATTNHLHFEVLKNGKAVNPMPYLTRGLAQVVSPDQLARTTATAQAKTGKKTAAR